jgi:hypothetical protein
LPTSNVVRQCGLMTLTHTHTVENTETEDAAEGVRAR